MFMIFFLEGWGGGGVGGVWVNGGKDPFVMIKVFRE